jgi:hypothetical protein
MSKAIVALFLEIIGDMETQVAICPECGEASKLSRRLKHAGGCSKPTLVVIGITIHPVPGVANETPNGDHRDY